MSLPSPITSAGVVQWSLTVSGAFVRSFSLFSSSSLWPYRHLRAPLRTQSPNSQTTNSPTPKRRSASSHLPAIRGPFRSSARFRTDRLSADPDTKKVFITQDDGKVVDAATGVAVDKLPDGADAVRLNNRLRRSVEAALGSLTLLSPDPAKRIAAAQSVFKSHDENALPVDRGRAGQRNQQVGEGGLYRGTRGDPAL